MISMCKDIENDIKLYAEDLCKNLRKWKSDKNIKHGKLHFKFIVMLTNWKMIIKNILILIK